MKKMSENAAARLEEPKLSVAPLIDVCFLLLIYFMVTMTIEPAERDLEMQTPSDRGTPPAVPPLSLVIHIRENGDIAVNPGRYEMLVSTDSSERELPQLKDHLEPLKRGLQGGPLVTVRAEGGAKHQRVVDVMNLLQELEITRVGFVDMEDDE